MKRYLLLIVAMMLALGTRHAMAQTPYLINCQLPSTACTYPGGAVATNAGDPPYVWAGKTNANFTTLAPLFTTPANSVFGIVGGALSAITLGTNLSLSGSTLNAAGGSGGITALTGDVTASGTGSVAASVVKVNGNAVTTSAAIAATDSSGHIIAATPAAAIGALNSCTANAQTGTTYTFVLGDANCEVTASNSSAQTYTIPPNSGVAYVTGTLLTLQQISTGLVALAPGSGVTIQSADYGSSASQNYSLGGQYGFIQLQKIATNTWQVLQWYVPQPTVALTGTCTNSASTANGVVGDITMSSAGNCTIIATISGGKIPLHFYMGLMCDLTQPTLPCWGPTTKTASAITWTVPTAVASTDHVEYGPVGYY